MKQSFHAHFDRDLTKAGSAILREAVRRGLLSQHEAMIHDQQWAQFSAYANESHEVDILEFVNKKLVREYGEELYIQTYQGNLPLQSVSGLLKTVYVVMDFATDGRWKGTAVNVGNRLGFPSHARITVPRSLDRTKFEAAMVDIQALASECGFHAIRPPSPLSSGQAFHGHLATCSTAIRPGSRSAATQGGHC